MARVESNLSRPSVSYAAGLAFREFIPRQQDREPLTWTNAPNAFLYLIPYFFLAYLVRRQGTYLMRLLLLPTVIAMTLRCTFRYIKDDPSLLWYEWNRGLLAMFVIAKSIDFALAKEGRLKLGEKELRRSHDNDGSPRHAGKERAAELLGRSPAARFLPRSVFDALEVGLTMRGVGWDFGKYTPIPRSSRPAERHAYVGAVVRDLIRNILLIDILDTVTKQVPGVTPTGGSIFLQELPPIERYALSTALHIAHGVTIYAGVCIVYDVTSLVGVILFHQSPSLWPPISGHLLEARSLHDFWVKTWHQAFRYTFLTLGGFAGQWLAGGIGMVFGCFAASAMFHEFGLLVAGKEPDMRVFIFFLLQAVGIALEKAFASLTGRRVGGWLGFLWTAIFVLGFGQICTDAWFSRGVGGAISIPPFMSVVRMGLLPLVRFVIRNVSGSSLLEL
ncbi:hypothetical protein PYCCODRAFT_1452719 [Trametes coccinea BRFM310]|uniref:Wax synthase domain-containing protein n=1 Tax=Trametes coccinea (strain BRFM310) TaxID=1353009 RepID=A0A1Y2IKL0_TRAC3|nr:hypothetical protein PYCCODRAFT_1452719 [Trametes coccinea BRFM310]